MTDDALRATAFLDHDSPEVADFTAAHLSALAPDATPVEQAVALYYAVRDGIRYEVYGADLSREGLRASRVLRAGSGMCLHKSVVYAAVLRSLGIPARLVLTDVRNHLASPRLIGLLGGDVFHQHCLTSVQLDGRWVKATPVFNRTLCRLYRITPLDFDGTRDSVHHPYGRDGRRQMEIVRDHGVFDDLPYEAVLADLRAAHPGLFRPGRTRFAAGSLTGDAARADGT
ncbi:transglutaminase-like domain-containing protein [Streptomyces sp. S186]|uniref:transglutaminase-like domain-containing protein n=1 Tax=Streptomyces sp. S186 TaxID=3434395 RepID=UPI003F670A34